MASRVYFVRATTNPGTAVTDEIEIGVVGAGFGRYGLVPAFRRDPRCRVVALCTASIETARKFSTDLDIPHAFADFSDMLASVPLRAVAIATPPYIQAAIAVAALDAGLAVFAEKPLACDLSTAKLLLARAHDLGVAHAVDFMFPELYVWRQARDLIQSGALGRIRHAMLDWRFESYDNARRQSLWKTKSELGGGALSHYGSHAFYNVEWLVGKISNLTAHLSTAPDMTTSGDTLVCIAVTFASGATGSLSVSSAALHGAGHRIEVYGESGTLTLVNDSTDPIIGFRLAYGRRSASGLTTIAREKPDERGAGEDQRVAPVSRIASRFLDAIANQALVCPSLAEGVRVQSLIESTRSSAAEAAWVSVADR